jgi:hypothetical protein
LSLFASARYYQSQCKSSELLLTTAGAALDERNSPMSKNFTRVVGGAMIAGALLAAAPAGLAFADPATDSDVVNPPPTDHLNGGQLNAVVNINKTPRSMGWDVRQNTAGWDVRAAASWSWDTRKHMGIGNDNALIALLRPAPTG